MPHFDHLPREFSDDDTDTESSSSVEFVKETSPGKPKAKQKKSSSTLAWREDVSKEPLDEFLASHKPSKTKTSSDGWIWIRSSRNPHTNSSREEKASFSEAVMRATKVEEEVREKAEEIKNDPNVPVRTSKKGPGRKDLIRKQGDILNEELNKIGASTPALATGKWMWFETPEKVDSLFGVLARSLIDGPLARMRYQNPDGPVVHTLKVATSDAANSGEDRRGPQFLICLYFDSIWNKKHAEQVLHSLAAEHGLRNPTAAKADLYTYVNLTSKHPTEARSSNWRPTELILTDVYDDLKDAFWLAKKSGDWDRAEKEDREAFRRIVGGRGSLGVGENGAGAGSKTAAAVVSETKKGKSKKEEEGEGKVVGADVKSKPASPAKAEHRPSTKATNSSSTASTSSTSAKVPARAPVVKPRVVAGKSSVAFANDSDSDEDYQAEQEKARERARRGGLARLAAQNPSSGLAKPFISQGPRVEMDPLAIAARKRSLDAMLAEAEDESDTASESSSSEEEDEKMKVLPRTKRVRLDMKTNGTSGSGSVSGLSMENASGKGKGKELQATVPAVASEAAAAAASE
ncbi:hypothetical protein A4X09_0g3965 [Tilletia walkeri]|uniref:Uncharacterized protein n=1 Tax=Tilletia walkeri TaxID=117179 RepID=A0A8X7N708_9BASI|nr:hypothetical protein A4X09_0g3965 [Tilletia walkeri]